MQQEKAPCPRASRASQPDIGQDSTEVYVSSRDAFPRNVTCPKPDHLTHDAALCSHCTMHARLLRTAWCMVQSGIVCRCCHCILLMHYAMRMSLEDVSVLATACKYKTCQHVVCSVTCCIDDCAQQSQPSCSKTEGAV